MNLLRLVLNVGSVVLVAALGWLIVRIVMGVMNPESLYAPEPIIVPSSSGNSASVARNYDFSSDPFSYGETTYEPLDEPIEDAPETSLNLTLKGIVSGSTATFKMPDGKDHSVKIGEEIMNGVTLMGTAKNFVTLDVNGVTERLTLERVKQEAKSDKALIVRVAPPKKAADFPTQAEAEELFSKLNLSPVADPETKAKGGIQGYRINGRSGADLTKYGLRSGDIATRVGPLVLNTTRLNFAELRELLSSGSAIDIEVIRDGSPVTIRLGQ